MAEEQSSAIVFFLPEPPNFVGFRFFNARIRFSAFCEVFGC